jgi:hypothetical protein
MKPAPTGRLPQFLGVAAGPGLKEKPARWGRAGFLLLGRRCCYEVRRAHRMRSRPQRNLNKAVVLGKYRLRSVVDVEAAAALAPQRTGTDQLTQPFGDGRADRLADRLRHVKADEIE